MTASPKHPELAAFFEGLRAAEIDHLSRGLKEYDPTPAYLYSYLNGQMQSATLVKFLIPSKKGRMAVDIHEVDTLNEVLHQRLNTALRVLNVTRTSTDSIVEKRIDEDCFAGPRRTDYYYVNTQDETRVDMIATVSHLPVSGYHTLKGIPDYVEVFPPAYELRLVGTIPEVERMSELLVQAEIPFFRKI